MFENFAFTKKMNGLAIVVALILCSFLGATAQENTFKEEDLRALANAATSEKLKGKTYRLTTTSVTYYDGNATPARTIKTRLMCSKAHSERIVFK